MDQISATPTDALTKAPDGERPGAAEPAAEPSGFGARGRARRRVRFLRKARELAYRDLGGLVFNLHRFGQRNDTLVMAKLTTLSHIDTELRALQATLSDSEAVTVLREAGITACPRCAAIHSSEDRFCPNCGLSLARHAEMPIASAAAPAAGDGAVTPPARAPTTGSHQVPAPPPPASTPASPLAPPDPASAPASQPAPPTPAPVSTHAAPAPARVAPSQPAPTPPPGGRSPAPPPSTGAAGVAEEPASPAREESTEILRPPTGGQ